MIDFRRGNILSRVFKQQTICRQSERIFISLIIKNQTIYVFRN